MRGRRADGSRLTVCVTRDFRRACAGRRGGADVGYTPGLDSAGAVEAGVRAEFDRGSGRESGRDKVGWAGEVKSVRCAYQPLVVLLHEQAPAFTHDAPGVAQVAAYRQAARGLVPPDCPAAFERQVLVG
jgi:hypothetical protein